MKPEQLTAWALNELSPDERAQIEAQLKTSPASAQQAAEVQAFCNFLTEHLVPGDAALTDEQRREIEQLDLSGTVVAADVAGVCEPGPIATASRDHSRANGASTKLAAHQKRHATGVKAPGYNWPMRITALAACIGMMGFVWFRAIPEDPRVAETNLTDAVAAENVRVQPAAGDTASGIANRRDQLQRLAVVPPPPASPISTAISNASLAPNNTKAEAGALADVAMTRPGSDKGLPSMKFDDAPAPPSAKRATAKPTYVAGPPAKERLRELRKQRADSFDPPPIPASRSNTEGYASIVESRFLQPNVDPLSTFSIDVDTASYANVRRFLNDNSLPPPDAVRIEELINYFPYNYEPPAKEAAQPFAVQIDVTEAPWEPTHRLARIGIKGRELGEERKAANFVFLIDVSGSMNESDKLPLVQRSLAMLTSQLKNDDRVAIVTYAGDTRVALESTPGKNKAAIHAVIDALQSGGGTNGASGIQLAYTEAQKQFLKEGINRVILCTDGDFNVGVSSAEELEKLIKKKAEGGVFLSVLGFGTGNLQDHKMETLADKGNGNYAYIDSLAEARKVLVQQMNGTLVTIAKDVKIQVEFNPTQVRAYRLLGYENRALANADFNNDRKDAGEIGAGHTVTALYEIVPMDAPLPEERPLVDDLKYQPKPKALEAPMLTGVPPQKKLEGINDEVMTVKLRYKEPDGELSKLIEQPVRDTKSTLKDAPRDLKFAAAAAGFGLLLRDSEHKGKLTWETVRKLAIQGKGEDKEGQRGEFIQLIDKAAGLSGQP